MKKLSLPTSVEDPSIQAALTYLSDSAMPRSLEIKNGEPSVGEGEQGVFFLRFVNKSLRLYTKHEGKLYYLEFV